MPPSCKFKIYRLLLFLLLATCIVDAKKVKKIKVKGSGKEKKLDITELGPPGQSISDVDEFEINVDVGAPFKKIKKLPGSRSVSAHWVGENEKGETMTLVRTRGRKGIYDILVGSLVDPIENVVHQIRQNADGETVMVSTPTEEFPPEKDGAHDEARALLEQPKMEKISLRGARTFSRRLQSDPIIRVLVTWTKSAECKQSSLAAGCTVTDTTHANMEALAELAIEETNTAYDFSGVDAELQLAFAYRDPGNYVEYDTSSTDDNDAFDNALRDLRGNGDGFMDDVHTKRTLYGADAVVVLIDDSAWCGLGYERTTPVADRMFSVTKWSCATGYYSFGHELSHNMGCRHDRGTKNQCDTSVNTNTYYGFRDTGGTFRSIMAYNCKTTQCDSGPTDSCTRVQRFSFPGDYIVGGVNQGAVGDANNDCAAQLNAVAESVSNFLATPTCGNGDVDTGEDCDLVNLNEESCESLGLDSGILQCDRECVFDTSLCSGNVPSGPTDVLFIVDTTGSYELDLPEFQTDAPTIMTNIRAENADTRFALVRFQDFPTAPWGLSTDVPYERVVDFTQDPDVMVAGIDGLEAIAGTGGDLKESQLEAIWQALKGPNKVSFRTEATKFIMLWTDAEFHRPETDVHPTTGDPYPGHTTQEVKDALTELMTTRRQLRRGLNDEPTPSIFPPFPPPPIWPVEFIGIDRGDLALDDLKEIALHTGTIGPFDCDGDGVSDIPDGEGVACPEVTGESGGSIGETITVIIEETLESFTPVAECVDFLTASNDDGVCYATVNPALLDGGSSDPGGRPTSFALSPPNIPVGVDNPVTLLVTNDYGYLDSCATTVTVTDDESPTLDCNIPVAGVDPDDTEEGPVIIQMVANDNCGVRTRWIDNLSCFKVKKNGEKKDLPCRTYVQDSPDGILEISATGGVGTHITWTIHATDAASHEVSEDCELVISNPSP